MTSPERHPDQDAGLDRLLRESLRDDLPDEVAAGLDQRWRAFLFSRRSQQRRSDEPRRGWLVRALPRLDGSTPARMGLAAAAALLLAWGLTLQAAAVPESAGEPMRRIQVSVSLFRTLQRVASLRCSGLDDVALDSPEALAAHVYRRWVPQGVRAGSEGSLVAAYRTADASAGYELVVDLASGLPRQVRRTDASSGLLSATCTWTAATGDTGAPR